MKNHSFGKATALALVILLIISVFGRTYLPVFADYSVQIYVSPEGNDENSGSFEEPVKTLEKARLLSRKYNNSSVVEIVLREGKYRLNRTFVLNELDSNVIYKSYENEKVILTGSRWLAEKDYNKVTDRKILNRVIDADARNNLYEINAKVLNIDLGSERKIGNNKLSWVDYGSVNPIIMINGGKGKVARWPDNSRVDIKEVVTRGTVGSSAETSPPTLFSIYQDRGKLWSKASDMYVYGQWDVGWTDQTLSVKGVSADNVVETVEPTVRALQAGGSIYFYNLLEEISQNGEYYVDVKKEKIYFCAENTENLELITLNSALVSISNTENIRFENIEFCGSRASGISLSSCENVVFDNCTIKNTEGYAFTISSTCKSCGIENSVISDVYAGINISGGIAETLTNGNNFAKNCLIENFGTQCYARGVSLSGVGNLLSDCTIRNSDHLAIQISGNNNVVENCDISNVLRHSGDMGAIYMETGWTGRGNIIKNNYFHDIKSEKVFQMGTRAIYLDLYTSGTTIIGNVFENAGDYCVVVANGRDNKVENNVFISNRFNYYISQADKSIDYTTLTTYTRLVSSYYRNEVWKNEYESLYNILDNNAPHYAEGNSLKNNLFIDSVFLGNSLNNITTADIAGYELNYNGSGTECFTEDIIYGTYTLNSGSAASELLPDYRTVDISSCGYKAVK